MKTVISFFPVLFAGTLLMAQDTIPNSGFERWEQVITWYEDPVDWETNNTHITPFVNKDTAAYEGKYSIELLTGGTAHTTFPLEDIPIYGRAFVRTDISEADTVWIKASFYTSDTIGAWGEWYTTETIDTFTEITFSIFSHTFFQPDSARIELIGGKNFAGQQTKLWVDEIEFEFPTGIGTRRALESMTIYPNPTSSQITVRFGNLADVPEKLVITDVKGRRVDVNTKSGQSLVIDVSFLSNGIYHIVGIQDGVPTTAGRFVLTK
jgi:hypothetical protein